MVTTRNVKNVKTNESMTKNKTFVLNKRDDIKEEAISMGVTLRALDLDRIRSALAEILKDDEALWEHYWLMVRSAINHVMGGIR